MRPSRLAVTLLALASLSMGVVACADDPDDSVASGSESGAETESSTEAEAPEIPVPSNLEDFTGQSEVTVTVIDNAFEQRFIQVDPGTTVTWVNEGTNNHNVIPAVEGSFEPTDGGEMPGNEDPPTQVTFTFDEAGEYPYYCSLHGTATAGQTGFVLVGDA